MGSRFGRYIPFLDSTVLILYSHVDYFKEWKQVGEHILAAGKPTPTLPNLPINSAYVFLKGVPGGSVVKIHLPMQKICVPPLGQEDPLQKEMPTDSSILAWEISWTEEPGGL